MEWLGDFPNRLPAGEALDLGWKVALMGITIVFLALVCLIILTIVYPKVFGWILGGSAKRKEKRAAKKAAALPAAKAPVEAAPAVSVSKAAPASADNGELVAAITAAIAASMGTSSNGIRIRSIRRSGASTPAWGREGRYEQFRF